MQKYSKQDCYILGTAYCGSTLLGASLNQHPLVAYVGELSRSSGFVDRFSLDNTPAECMECLISQKKCTFISEKFIAKTTYMTPSDAHNSLRKVFKKPIVVDGSKHPAWLRIAHFENTSTEIKVIILSRSPSSYLKSCLSRGIEPLWAEANAWRDNYLDALRTVNQLGLSCKVVRHEDFIKNPLETLQGICQYLGVKFTKNVFNTSAFELHAFGGNPGAYLESGNKKAITEYASSHDQKDFDINPARLKTTLFAKAQKQRQLTRLRQIAFESPGLVDTASLLGYKYNDL